ncbi:hypothetical protein D3C78_1543140 [compost metagenome]
MVAIAQLQLQGVFARRERYFSLGLRGAEMLVIGVFGDRYSGGWQLIDIDQQMVMSGVLGEIARRCQGNILDSELDDDSLWNIRAVLGRHDRHFGAFRSRRCSTGQHRNTHQQARQSST